MLVTLEATTDRTAFELFLAGGKGLTLSGGRVASTACGLIDPQYHTQYEVALDQSVSVRHALLALLIEGPKYGLQLRQEFEARTGDAWPLNVGQVYTTLQRLERDGLVEPDDAGDDGPQKGLRITTAGERDLAEWLRTPPDMASPPRDELVIKLLVAMRVPGVDVRDVVQVHRRYLVELMQQYTRLKEDAAEGDLGLALVVDSELFRLDAVIRWLDSADSRIKRAPEHPPARSPSPMPRLRGRIGVQQ